MDYFLPLSPNNRPGRPRCPTVANQRGGPRQWQCELGQKSEGPRDPEVLVLLKLTFMTFLKSGIQSHHHHLPKLKSLMQWGPG